MNVASSPTLEKFWGAGGQSIPDQSLPHGDDASHLNGGYRPVWLFASADLGPTLKGLV